MSACMFSVPQMPILGISPVEMFTHMHVQICWGVSCNIVQKDNDLETTKVEFTEEKIKWSIFLLCDRTLRTEKN